MRRLLFSDVHLSPARPDVQRRWLAVWRREIPRADEVYILGDLFDYWIGPKQLEEAAWRPAVEALRRAGRDGVRIVFLPGNRDFYLRGLPRATGVEVAPGPLDLEFSGTRVHLCHGDHLCTEDRASRRARAIIRSPVVEAVFTRLPARLATFLARGYRRHSHLATRRKPPQHVRLAEKAVMEVFDAGADVIVCGHLHRAARHVWRSGGREKVLYALGDWAARPSYLIQEDGSWTLVG